MIGDRAEPLHTYLRPLHTYLRPEALQLLPQFLQLPHIGQGRDTSPIDHLLQGKCIRDGAESLE